MPTPNIYILVLSKFIPLNGTQFINAAHIFSLTRGPTRSWRNGDAQCCLLSNIADPFSEFFSLKKAPKPYLVSKKRRYCEVLLSQHAHTPLSLSLSAQFLFSTIDCKKFSTCTHISLSLLVCSVSFQRARTHLSLSPRLLSFFSAHAHTSLFLSLSLSLHLLSFCSARSRDKQSLIQLNRYYVACFSNFTCRYSHSNSTAIVIILCVFY